MKKKLLLFLSFMLSLWSYGQFTFPTVTGPISVSGGTAENVPINDAANAAAVPAGLYDSFSVSVDWVSTNNAWASEADLTINTSGGSVTIDPPTTGSASSGAATTLTFSGSLTSLYDPSVDGLLTLDLNQSYSSSDADWSNIVVTLFEAPTCPDPLDLGITNLTATTVDLGWTEFGTATTWNVEYGAAGFTPGSGTTVSTTTNPHNLTGLTENTSYDIYVQADCGSSDVSNWVGPISITTLQTPVSLPYTDDFSSNNWVLGNGTQTNQWHVGGAEGNPANSLYITNDGGTTNAYSHTASVVHASKVFTLPAGSNPFDFSFEWKAGGESSHDYMRVWLIPATATPTPGTLITTTNITGAERLSPQYLNLETIWQTENYEIASSYAGTDVKIVFEWRNDWSSGTTAGAAVDNISFTEITCPAPTSLLVDNFDVSTADISWTAGDSETAWNVSWGAPGYTPGDGDEVGNASVTSPSYQITGLTADTHYDVYVQADCGAGDESMWVGPLTIYTGYCVPTSTGNTTRYIDGVVTQGALMNINNTGTSLSPDAYGDYTGTDTLRVYPGQEISVEFTHPSTTYHYKIWVDWDSDLDFDGSNDLIYATTSYQSSPHLVDITIPALTPEGVYRMRVRNSSTTLGGPCGNNASSETEDYILHIVSPPSCLPVSDIATTSATFQTSTITWTANNSETSWNISWGNPGYTPGDGDELGTDVSTSTTYQITGLTGDTHYDVYVQADCGGGDESIWAGPYTIFTGYCEVSTTNSSEYLIGIESDGAISDISYSATTQPAGSYANETAQLFRAFPGQTFEISSTYSGSWSNGVNIWVDWDQDLNFDATELWSYMSGSSSTHVHEVEVPAGTAPGTYRVRVRGQFGSSANPPACGSVSYGSTIDFNLVVIECTTTPGIDGYAEVCRAEGTIELNDVATLSSTEGTWEFDMNPTLLNGSELNVSSLPAGSYDVLYVVDFPGCIEDTTVATIEVFGPSSAGTGGIISVCAGAPINLYSALSGNVDIGGDWYDYNGNLLGTSQPTAPSLGASYNYTYITSNGVCDADTAFVEVIVDASPDCTSNIQEEMAVNLSVYPNPTTDVLHIVNPTNIAALKVEVLDMNGRIVLVENSALKNTTEATISLGNLNTGVYTLRVYNEEGQKIFKVVKR